MGEMVKMVAMREKKTLKANLRDASYIQRGQKYQASTVVTNQINSGILLPGQIQRILVIMSMIFISVKRVKVVAEVVMVVELAVVV